MTKQRTMNDSEQIFIRFETNSRYFTHRVQREIIHTLYNYTPRDQYYLFLWT
jgi:hypothetical protein